MRPTLTVALRVQVCVGDFEELSYIILPSLSPRLPLWFVQSRVVELWDMCPTPVAEVSQQTLPASIERCIDSLEVDYATCGLAKQLADERFVDCATVAITSMSASELAHSVFQSPPIEASTQCLSEWWLSGLAAVQLPQAAIGELSTAFDCEKCAALPWPSVASLAAHTRSVCHPACPFTLHPSRSPVPHS